jgi:hypothetical protein
VPTIAPGGSAASTSSGGSLAANIREEIVRALGKPGA